MPFSERPHNPFVTREGGEKESDEREREGD